MKNKKEKELTTKVRKEVDRNYIICFIFGVAIGLLLSLVI